MKFWDPATGKVFKNICEARGKFCLSGNKCSTCEFENCVKFSQEHPAEAARLMGYEVIEDTPTKEDDMDKQEKPLSEWTLREAKRYCVAFRETVDDSDVCEETDGCVLREKGICKKANRWPHLWDLNSLTEPEIAIMQAMGAKWVSRDENRYDGSVDLWMEKPLYGDGMYNNTCENGLAATIHNSALFTSVHPGECIEVEECMGAGDGQ